MELPAMGYGLRYEYGMFRQVFRDGWQQEQPDNWLLHQDPWEVVRPHEQVRVNLNCSYEVRGGRLRAIVGKPSSLIGVPYDRPVVGYGGKTINTLRLWEARTTDYFDFQEFGHGEFVGAMAEALEAASLTRVLYPDDSTTTGQGLRFVQEYFLVACSHSLAATIDGDPAVRGRLRVLFLPEYDVSLAERLIPASDVSNQISTAGYEASGTSNMKFMMNGALTLGTRDGATIEMAQEAGESNFFFFGLTADQVAGSRGWYDPHWHYDHEPETRAVLDLVGSGHFSRGEPGLFMPLLDTLLTHGDYYMHLADLKSYLNADERMCALYAKPDEWAHMAVLNVAASGKFSSDRTIAEYAAQIWEAKPCPVA
jgi:glucan phosphorylase